ncbi:ecdysteroid kinase domain-containing protein [Phthorimaea operculella]|nr:ecdysteroid kinase domain-containing protein [Phthorimaea operculella]
MYKITSTAFIGEIKKKVDELFQKSLEVYPMYWKDTTSMGCTICHGDYSAYNILVKNTNGKICDMVPVDYQLLHYGSPLKDFMSLIFSGSDQEFRKKHLTDLKNLYYDHLGKFLGYFNMNVTDVYTTREEFEKLFADTLKFGLIHLLYFTPLLFANHEQPSNLSDLKKIDFNLDDRYRARIQGIVDDFIQWGYL